MTWSLAWWLILVASWNLRRDYQLDFFCVVSPCGLSFLTTWPLDSKGKRRQTETEAGGSHIAAYMTGSLPPHSVSQSSYKDLSKLRGRECRLSPLKGKTLWEDWVRWDIYCPGPRRSTENEIWHSRAIPLQFPLMKLVRKMTIQWSLCITESVPACIDF